MDIWGRGQRWGCLWVIGGGAIRVQFLKNIGHKHDNMNHTYLFRGLI